MNSFFLSLARTGYFNSKGVTICNPSLVSNAFDFHQLYQRCLEKCQEINSFNQFHGIQKFKHLYIDVRGSHFPHDQGIIDIFSPELSDNTLLDSAVVNEIISIARSYFDPAFNSRRYTFHHSNIYLYKSVTNPRRFHVDSFTIPHFKVFMAKDVIASLSDGPYGYIPFSQKLQAKKIMSYLANKIRSLVDSSSSIDCNDMIFYNRRDAVFFLPKPGEFVVTSQHGVHGDFPAQNNKAVRSWIVLNYYPSAET